MNKLVFGDIEVSKEKFCDSKIGLQLREVEVDKIVVSNQINVNDDISKVFIGYMDNNVVPLCLLLPQMSDWIKYFKNGGKNMSFKIEDEEVYLKYNEIWNKIRKLLYGVKLSSDINYDDQYIKTKGKTFKMVKTLFDGDKIPEEKVEYEFIPCISIDSLLKVDKKSYPQVYLEQCKYKMKKREIKTLIDYEIDLDSDYESD